MKKHDHKKRFLALHEIALELLDPKKKEKLFDSILDRAMDLLSADAASLYLLENETKLRFAYAKNQSISINFKGFLIDVDHPGIAATVFRNQKTLNLKDAYQIEDQNIRFDRSFDERNQYRTLSVLTCPLKNTQNQILGVIQVINKKSKPDSKWGDLELKQRYFFDSEDEFLLESFAALASISLENTKLYEDIKGLFAGFAKAAVTAIESRDPITSGHSSRVADLCLELVDLSEKKGLLNFNFAQREELRVAALLHDFGKIGVPEQTLQKQEKLTCTQKKCIDHRIDSHILIEKNDTLLAYFNRLLKENRKPTSVEWNQIQERLFEFEKSMDSIRDAIFEYSKPSLLATDAPDHIDQLLNLELKTRKGIEKLLDPEMADSLKTKRGSLNTKERLEIESHVTHTYLFLKQIPWTKDLSNVPEIAYAHHEYLDGSGYPRKLTEPTLPYQARILTVCDIFDALAARDRPYKKAVPLDKAIEILKMDADKGKLDLVLVKLLIESNFISNPLVESLYSEKRKAA